MYPYLYEAEPDDFGREWLDYKMSVATVGGLREAIEFVSNHTSHHSEAIIADNKHAQEAFMKEIDAGMRLCERVDGLYRRRTIRIWRRDRYFYAKTACPRANGSAGNHDL